MRRRVEEFIRKQALFGRGSRVLAAVSGGADSVCLLYLLAQIREEWELELRALHVNHGIRGEEACRDEAFTKKLCQRLSVPCKVCRVDAVSYAREQRLSLEEGARKLRYEALEEEASCWERQEGEPVKVAVAHHGDDNVETILHNLFRGSGLKGLGGIRPRRGKIIRPLLTVTRKEILSYIEENHLSYCEDSTNASEDYTRNKLRHQVMPLICSQINGRAPEHILQAAQRLSQADEYLEGRALLWLKQYGAWEKDEGQVIRAGADAGKLSREEPIIQTYVIRQLIRGMAGSWKDIASIHVENARELLEKQAGKQADLPCGLMARRTYGYLWVEQKGQMKSFQPPKAEFKTFSYEKGMEIPQNRYTKWFDYDKIKSGLSVRTRQAGDYFVLPGGGRKTIKSYFIDEKIPAMLRDGVFLLAEGSHVLWVIGRRISEAYKVTDRTKRILQVHVSGGNEDGR